MNPLRRSIRNASRACWQPTIVAFVIAVSFGCGIALAFVEHAARSGRWILSWWHHLAATYSQFESYKPGQNRCRIKLAYDAFEIAKTSRQRMHGNDVAVTRRCQGDKAEIEK